MNAISDSLEPVEWLKSEGPVPYPDAVHVMERRVAAIRSAHAAEAVWLLEHPPLYTAGTSADPAELVDADRFPVYDTGRGGRYTYHGPGQRVGYVMLDLSKRRQDVRAFVRDLEEWIIRTLAEFGVTGERREGRIGIWVVRDQNREDKIAAIGVRVRRWVTFHGISLNVSPELDHFSGIIPCGIAPNGIENFGVTSLRNLGIDAGMQDVDDALQRTFKNVFKRSLTPVPA